jgi:hypothetical protein
MTGALLNGTKEGSQPQATIGKNAKESRLIRDAEKFRGSNKQNCTEHVSRDYTYALVSLFGLCLSQNVIFSVQIKPASFRCSGVFRHPSISRQITSAFRIA